MANDLLLSSIGTCIDTIDKQLLLAINGCNSPFFDNFFFNISSKWIWIPLYITMVYLLIKRYGKHSVWLLLAFALVAVAADQSSHLLKHFICRPRPTHDECLSQYLHIVNNYRGGRYGFPSSHAADTFSIALLFSLIWHDYRATLPLMFYALLNCYSRNYLAVHYPLDIVAGLLLGCLLALVAATVLRFTLRRKSQYIIKDITPVMPSYLNYALIFVLLLTLAACCIV